MKKNIVLILTTLALLLSMTACGTSRTDTDTSLPEENTSASLPDADVSMDTSNMETTDGQPATSEDTTLADVSEPAGPTEGATSEPVQTAEDATEPKVSMDDLLTLMEGAIAPSYDYADVEVNGSIIAIYVANDGFGKAVTTPGIENNEEVMEIWKSTRGNLADLSGSCQDLVEVSGYTDYTSILFVLDDRDLDTVLASFSDGVCLAEPF